MTLYKLTKYVTDKYLHEINDDCTKECMKNEIYEELLRHNVYGIKPVEIENRHNEYLIDFEIIN